MTARMQFSDTVFKLPPDTTLRAELRQRVDMRHEQLADAEQIRQANAVGFAYRNGLEFGRHEGYKAGYRAGTHWGMFCGFFGTALCTAIAVAFVALGTKVTHLW